MLLKIMSYLLPLLCTIPLEGPICQVRTDCETSHAVGTLVSCAKIHKNIAQGSEVKPCYVTFTEQ